MRFQRIVQLCLFLLFVGLLWKAAYPLPTWIPVDLFLRLDPLISAGTMIVARAWIPSVVWGFVILSLAVFLGRFFCGHICPMGITLDVGDRFLSESRERRGTRRKKDSLDRFRSAKYLFLAALITSALAGVSLLFLGSPLSLVTRFFVLVAVPLVSLASDFLIGVSAPVAAQLGWNRLVYAQVSVPQFTAALFTAALFLSILLLGVIRPRFWCRTLCPAGALLAMTSWRPLIRRSVDHTCTRCGICIRRCPMGAIPEDPHSTAHSECIVCLKCTEVCPENAVSFRWSPPDRREHAVNVSRRHILAAGGVGLLTAGLALTHPRSVHGRNVHGNLRHPDLIRPPGALPEKDFLDRCIRCGACLKVCPTNTLQPIWFEAGLDGVWSPRVRPRMAACEQDCNLCGRVCPTGAIRSLIVEEKRYAKIGTAFIERFRCVAWEEDRKCLICDEICPYNAIVMRPVPGNRSLAPFVNEPRCNGCGYCELKCPVLGQAAIRVSPHGELRLATGSYRREARRLGLIFKAEGGLEEEFLFLEDAYREPDPETDLREELPPGFILNEEETK